MSVAAKREERLAVTRQKFGRSSTAEEEEWTAPNSRKRRLKKFFPFFLKKDLLFLKRCHIIVKAIRSKGVFQKRVTCEQLHNAELCNGSTADSDSVCEGSNPSSAAIEVWLSLVERYVRDVEAGGSNPLTSTSKSRVQFVLGFFASWFPGCIARFIWSFIQIKDV